MVEISKSGEAKAPVGSVWSVISDLENEHKQWPLLRDVKILSRTETSIEREVSIRRGPMGDAKSVNTLTLDPAAKSTTLTLTKGPMLGTRTIALTDLGDGRTRIDVEWEFEMKGVPGFAMGFVKDNISDVTEKSLAEIAGKAERTRT